MKEEGGCFTGYAHVVTCCDRTAGHAQCMGMDDRTGCRNKGQDAQGVHESGFMESMLTTTDVCGNKVNQDLS